MSRTFRHFVLFLLASSLLCSCRTERKPAPLVLVGIDGMDWRVVDTLFAQGRMPNLRKLVDGGVRADLRTIEPTLSPVIWTTIATGRRPAEHGILGFVQKDEKTGRQVPVSSFKRKVKALWNIVSDLGHKVAFVGWWASWPAEKVRGVIVSDHLAYHGFGLSAKAIATQEGIVSPQGLSQEMVSLVVPPSAIPDREILEYLHLTPAELATRRGDRLDFTNPLHHLAFALATSHTYERIALRLLETARPELLGVYLEMGDSVSHLFMKYVPPPMQGMSPQEVEKYKDAVYRAYDRQDEILGALVAKAGPDASFVVASDHGFKIGDERLVELAHTDLKQAHLWHAKLGVLVLSGPRFARGVRLPEASVYDVAPTILYALGEKPAHDMQGRILSGAFSTAWRRDHPLLYVDTYEPAGGPEQAKGRANPDVTIDNAVMERLAALGYVERLDGRSGVEAALDEAQAADGRHDDAAAMESYGRAIDAACGKDRQRGEECAGTSVRVSAFVVGRISRPDAARLFARMQKLLGDRAEAHYLQGLADEGRGDGRAALAAYERAIALDPTQVYSLNNAAGLLAESGDRAAAARYYAKAASLDPKHLESRFNLGLIAIEERRYKDAVGFMDAVLGLRPDFAPAFVPKIRAEVAAGMLDRAADDVLKYRNVEKNPLPSLVLESIVARASGDTANADRLLARARGLDPKATQALLDGMDRQLTAPR
jgi:predicted AlkP superfamily pyrophosphatase or phosphodiesterase/tetratricopeptide (TPR) repeat protein